MVLLHQRCMLLLTPPQDNLDSLVVVQRIANRIEESLHNSTVIANHTTVLRNLVILSPTVKINLRPPPIMGRHHGEI